MIEQGDRVVVGVSGGADSVCLFFVLLELQKQIDFSIFVVHINHMIREVGAREDQNYVEQLCYEYGIPCKVITENIKELADREKQSEEEAGRKVRYQAFYDGAKQYKANKIAVAHHQNDQAETVLFHLFRGSGLRGIGGMLPVREEIIRPLLCVTREEIEKYLKERKISYQTDETNLEDIHTRNKIRLHTLSYVTKEINERAIEHIGETANIVREAEEYIKKQTENAFRKVVFEKKRQYFLMIAPFLKEDIVIQKMIIKKIFSLCSQKSDQFQSEHIQQVINLMRKNTGKQLQLPYHIIVKKQYEYIKFILKEEVKEQPREQEWERVVIPPTEIMLENKKLKVKFSIMKLENQQIMLEGEKLDKEDENFIIIPKNSCTKWFDYDRMVNTVVLRNRRQGDYFQINQKGSHKKIKDYFIDKKVPKEDREEMVLLADGKHIIWILGDRISEAYKVNKKTRRILVVDVIRG